MPEPPMMPRTDLVMEFDSAVTPDARKRDPGSMYHDGKVNVEAERWVPRPGRQCEFTQRNYALMHLGPHLLLGEVHQAGEDDQEDHHLEADALARLEVRLGGPRHERRDVLGVLVD